MTKWCHLSPPLADIDKGQTRTSAAHKKNTEDLSDRVGFLRALTRASEPDLLSVIIDFQPRVTKEHFHHILSGKKIMRETKINGADFSETL